MTDSANIELLVNLLLQQIILELITVVCMAIICGMVFYHVVVKGRLISHLRRNRKNG